jgi:tRNA-specific 2-thiouridylase
VDYDIPHYIHDIRNDFNDSVVNNFIDEYMNGRTPNPCIMCNTHIKWGALLRIADTLGCEYIATGHYAIIRKENDRYILSSGVDTTKDQSYVLWGLTQEVLARTIFPVGSYEKTQIRQMAMDRGYADMAKKSESYEICFVPDNDYRSFLKHRVPGLEQSVAGGNFVNTEGKILGKHKGYPFYTIGQRKGLELAFGEPMFVLEIIPETNTVVIGREEQLKKKGMWVRNLNLQKYASLEQPLETITKIRYKDPGATAILEQHEDRMRAIFFQDVKGIAPGQSAVFYEGNDVVGGGWIQSSFEV